MRLPRYTQSVLIGAAAVIVAGARYLPNHDQRGPIMTAVTQLVSGSSDEADAAMTGSAPAGPALEAVAAVNALTGMVRPLSHPKALEDAFRSYYAYKAAHPDEIKKPYLYFVDYGLPSTTERGYVFDMNTLKIVDGPFTVAHGRGSSSSLYGVPTRFSNASGSNATSLGLYVTKALYQFHGHSAGRLYTSVGVQLEGVSTGFNDNAFARRVVAHGAPYVTAAKAGRSEGCPAMEPARAQRLLPELANGSMVYLFAPDATWMAGDPWLTSGDAA